MSRNAPSPCSREAIAAQVASPFRYASFTPEGYLKDQALMRAVDHAPSVTCGQFRALAKPQDWTEDDVVAECRGEIDEPRCTIHRILFTNPSDTVIPYTCLIQLYEKATAIPMAQPGQKSCERGGQGQVRGK
jgi:hypothetical protein